METGVLENLPFTEPVIEAFLQTRRAEGTPASMQRRYAQALRSVRRYLRSREYLTRSDLPRWQVESIQAGYSPNTVNCMTGAVNTFLTYMGYAEWRISLVRAGARRKARQPET